MISNNTCCTNKTTLHIAVHRLYMHSLPNVLVISLLKMFWAAPPRPMVSLVSLIPLSMQQGLPVKMFLNSTLLAEMGWGAYLVIDDCSKIFQGRNWAAFNKHEPEQALQCPQVTLYQGIAPLYLFSHYSSPSCFPIHEFMNSLTREDSA